MEGQTSSPLAPASRDARLSVSMQKTLFLAESVMLRFRIGYLDWSTVQGTVNEGGGLGRTKLQQSIV